MATCRSQISRINVTAAGVLAYAARHNISTESDGAIVRTDRREQHISFRSARRRKFPNRVEGGKPLRKRRRRRRIKRSRPTGSFTNTPLNVTEFHFDEYVRCLSARAKKVIKCIPKFIASCSSADLRVVKLVRGEMRDVEPLMRMSRNFRVVHLIRDPRGVINSRRRINFFRAIGVKGRDMTPESSYYCADVIRDIKLGQQLEAKYPGRIIQIIYDDFVTNAHETIRNLYEFLDRKLPAEVVSFANTAKPSTVSTWKTKLRDTAVQHIDETCKGMYELLSENGETVNFGHNTVIIR